MRALKSSIALLALLGIVVLTGCSKDDNKNTLGPNMGVMRVQMTDGVADFDAVNLVVVQVAVHMAGADTGSAGGWTVVQADSQTVNLLALRNGVFRTIALSNVTAGPYDQMRLILGPGSTVVQNGVTYPLTIPSGMRSGLKIVGDFSVPSGGTADLALDFDANRSIVQTGAGTFILHPVVRAVRLNTTGSISGTVSPAGANTNVAAISTTADTLATTITAADGAFRLSALPAGRYSVGFAASGFRDTTLTNVIVTQGGNTNVGLVTLTPMQAQ